MAEFLVVIPARYGSTRLPGKPLRSIVGKPMLQHVHERARESGAAEVIVATDDERIRQAAEGFGASVCMTSAAHGSGSERIAEVARLRRLPGDAVVVNLQGDEPLMPGRLIDQCAGLLDAGDADLATLASPFAARRDFENPNMVKALVDDRGFAIYFSRAPLPFAREPENAGRAMQSALHHHGIYAWRTAALQAFVAARRSALEECEQLEQLRALSMGLRIRVGIPDRPPGPGVDTEDDVARVERLLSDSHN